MTNDMLIRKDKRKQQLYVLNPKVNTNISLSIIMVCNHNIRTPQKLTYPINI